MAGSNDTNEQSSSSVSARRSETLGYLCDIIVELKLLADRSGQRTLSAILAAALTEARIQDDTDRRRDP